MTPDEMVASFGKKVCIVNKLTYYNLPSHFCMMILKQYDKDGRHIYFHPATPWHNCREDISGRLRRRKTNESFSLREHTGKKNGYGDQIIKTIKVVLKDTFGPDTPMCLAFAGITVKQARRAQKILNLLEKESGMNEKTLVRTITLKTETIKDYWGTIKGKTKKGPMFIIPAYWCTSIPHMSFYLLIIRMASKMVTRNTKTFSEWCNKVIKCSQNVDNNRIANILRACPELPQMLLKQHKKLEKTLPTKWGGIPSRNGIDALLIQVYKYAYGKTIPNVYNKSLTLRKKGQTLKSYRASYIKCVHITHRKLVSTLGPMIKRHNRKLAKESKK